MRRTVAFLPVGTQNSMAGCSWKQILEQHRNVNSNLLLVDSVLDLSRLEINSGQEAFILYPKLKPQPAQWEFWRSTICFTGANQCQVCKPDLGDRIWHRRLQPIPPPSLACPSHFPQYFFPPIMAVGAFEPPIGSMVHLVSGHKTQYLFN